MNDLLARAERLANEVLFPASLATDTGARVPEAHLQLLAREGLFGVFGPPELGGIASASAVFAQLVEVLASGCLTTAFVWIQHHIAVQALAATPDSALARAWLADLCAGRRRTGLALGGLRPGPLQLRARPVSGGWLLDGTVPWVTGWQLVDALLAFALSPEQERLSLLLDAVPADTLSMTPQRLVAANASCTVEIRFREHFVARERLVASEPYTPPPAHDGEHAERLAREALFLLVFGSRPAIRTALLETLGVLGETPPARR